MSTSKDVEDRLLHARNLLKKYQTKQNTFNGVSPGIFKVNNFEESQNCLYNGGGNPSTGSTPPASVVGEKYLSSNHSSSNHLSQQYLAVENAEITQLKRLLHEKERSLNEALGKLHELHTHYSDLYSAYNVLIQTAQSDAPPEYALQISQLQTALAVATEEKTGFQTELRNLKLQFSELEDKNCQENLKKSSSIKLEHELSHLKRERDQLLETVASQSAQLETHRKECSNLEAKIILIHQDKNETQTRLKYLYEEKTVLEKAMEKLRNDLNMKEIYIRQLTRFSSTDTTQDQLFIQALSDEKKRSDEEVERRRAEILDLKKQFNSARQQYETCIADMGRHIASLEAETQTLKATKIELESVRNYQEEQLRILKSSVHDDEKDAKEEIEDVNNVVNVKEFTALQTNFIQLQADFSRCRDKIQDLELLIEQKDSQLDSLQFEFIDAQRKIGDFEESARHHASMNADVSTLSEQLQNEKVTVSRAVTQNIELKKQLQELQDRLVEVINDYASKENERLSLIATVKTLYRELDELKDTTIISKDQSVNDSVIPNAIFVDSVPFHNTNVSLPSVEQDHLVNNDYRTVSQLVKAYSECSKNDGMNLEPTQMKEAQKFSDENVRDYTFLSEHVGTSTFTNDEADEDSPSQHLSNTMAENDNVLNGPLMAVANQQQHPQPTSPNDSITMASTIASIQPMLSTTTIIRPASTTIAELSEKEFRHRLEELTLEKEKYRLNSERLEHLLTIVEMENESIGEYITIYHFQRANVQKKVQENDAMLKHLQEENLNLTNKLMELQTAVLALTSQFNGTDNTLEPTAHAPLSMINENLVKSVNNLENSNAAHHNQSCMDAHSIMDEPQLVPSTNGLAAKPTEIEPDTVNNNATEKCVIGTEVNEQMALLPTTTITSSPSENPALEKLLRIVEKQRTCNLKHKCNGDNSAQSISCSGCVECRGKLFTL